VSEFFRTNCFHIYSIKNILTETDRQNWRKFCAWYTCSINRSDVETFEQKWAKASRFLISLSVVLYENLQRVVSHFVCVPTALEFCTLSRIYSLEFFHFIRISSVVKFAMHSFPANLFTGHMSLCQPSHTKVPFSFPSCKLYLHTQTYRFRVTFFTVAWNNWLLSEMTFLWILLPTGETIY